MGIQQKAGRLTPAMAVLVSGVLLVAGCSDSGRSSGGGSLSRNNWQEGVFPTLTSPADTAPNYQSLIPGESYTFTWIGGAGALATLKLQRYEEAIHNFVTQTQVENIRNSGSYRMLLPNSLPRGLYWVKLATFNDHRACGLVTTIPNFSYFSMAPRALAYSPSKDRVGHSGTYPNTASDAVNLCNNPDAGCTDPVYCAPTNDCQLIDVNGSVCKGGAAGESASHFFTIGPVNQGVIDQATAYFQPENSKSNQAAAAAQMKPDAEVTPEGFVQISFENDAKDDKSVQHIAHATVGGGR